MGTRRTLLEYASDVTRLCPDKKMAQELCDDLSSARSFITSKRLDLGLCCTHGEANNCHILEDLSPWNECLCTINLELKEAAPGKLGIFSLRGLPLPETYEHNNHLAYVLLHWLLQEHRCIMKLELSGEAISWRHKLLFDGISRCSGLRQLKLTVCNTENTDGCADDLAAAIDSLEKLEKLELATLILSLTAQKQLVRNFQRLQSLRSLAFLSVDTLEDDKPTAEDPSASFLFGEYLANNTSLKKLSIDMGKGQVPQLEPLLQALRRNKSLERLHFDYIELNKDKMEALAEAVAESTTLRVLEISFLSTNFKLKTVAKLIERNTGLRELRMGYLEIKDVAPLAQAIRVNRTLKKLSFFWQSMKPRRAAILLEALASNSSLELVSIGEVYDDVLAEFYRTLVATGTKERVRFNFSISDPFVLMQVLHGCPDLTEMKYERSLENAIGCASLGYGVQMMASSSHLRTLVICTDSPVNKQLASCLVILLSTTKTLKEVHLEFGTTKKYTQSLLDKGLGCNKTISRCALVNWEFTETDAKVLGRVLKESTTLNYLLVESEKVSFVPLMAELLNCVHENRHLLDLSVIEKQTMRESRVDTHFEIDDVIRRNASHVHRAVQFVMGWDGHCFAEAFERWCESQEMLERVKKAASVTESEAKEMIAKRLSHLRMNFMVAVGIVRTSVACERPDDGGLQLDQIGTDSWLHIRSYLRAADIKKPSVEDQ
ncbi:unnamed protein product [Ixodes hexagonus]